ncbi:MAG: HAD-IC family P-type ATPase, partial [Fervidobacterium sp.]
EGLTEKEATLRLVKYGKNEIVEKKEFFVFKLFLRNIFNPISIALILAGLVSYVIGDTQSSLIIFAIVLLSAIFNFIQEYRSHNALDKLKKYITYTTHTIRDNKIFEIDSKFLVPGDIVVFTVGDRIPADLRIIEEENLAIDESLITGEYYPVKKTSKTIKKTNPLPQEMENIAFSGSIVKEGKGKGIVIATGVNSFMGATTELMQEIETESNFEKDLNNFSKYLLNIILLLVAIVAFVNIYVGHDLIISLLFAITLAVGLIPEPLPMILTSILSRGALKLASKGVIVKRLSATEDLGNVDILCCDKTGTLTENRLRVLDSFDFQGNENKLPLVLGSVCTSVSVKGHHISGNSIDVALYNNLKLNDDLKQKVESYEVKSIVPFDYERQRMSVAADLDGKQLLIVKGSPESILSISRFGIENGKTV